MAVLITVQCQFCGTNYRVAAARAGQFLDCTGCGARLTVPEPEPERPTAEGFGASDEPDPADLLRLPTLRFWGWIFRVLSTLAIVGLLAALFVFRRGAFNLGPNPRPPGVARGARAIFKAVPRQWRPIPAGPRNIPRVFRNQSVDASEGAPATPVAWSVAVDPATDAPTIPPDRDVNIAIPEGPNPQIVFPATPSTMVCVGNVGHGREHREIWDLRTNLKLGTTRGLRTLSENLGGFFKPISALSPDGRVFVTQGLRPFDLVVWDVAAEKQIGVVIPEHAPTAGLTFAAFARPERLVACGIGTPFQMLGIAIPSRTRMRKFPREHEYDRNSLAIIRGGRYLSVFDKSKLLLRIYDSESAMPVGQLSLPPFVPAAPMNCDCVAFSSDRQELAALFSYNSRSYLACWDLRNGRLTDRIDFGGNLRAFLGARFAYLDPPLEWFPDRRHWLVYGQGIVDRRAGKLIWQIPDEPTRMPHGIRHVAGSDCVLSVVNENGRFVLRSLRLRLKDIDRAAQAPGGFNEKIRN